MICVCNSFAQSWTQWWAGAVIQTTAQSTQTQDRGCCHMPVPAGKNVTIALIYCFIYMWHDQGKWVNFLWLQNASFWCKPHYNWISVVTEFDNAKNNKKQRNLNTVYANISKTTSPTSDSFLLIMSHIMICKWHVWRRGGGVILQLKIEISQDISQFKAGRAG